MRLTLFTLRTLFDLLYHPFAWTYDFVAATVSLGRWNEWVRSALPYLSGRVLEIGYGPGHLQASLHEKGLAAFGLDESRQMARQAGRRLCAQGFPAALTRGRAQHLPFPPETFITVAATFPSEYIFDPQTLEEIRRVLLPSGRLVILPMAWITGGRLPERLAAWLFRVTGEAPGKPGAISATMRERFTRAGFEAHSELVNIRDSQVLVILASKVE